MPVGLEEPLAALWKWPAGKARGPVGDEAPLRALGPRGEADAGAAAGPREGDLAKRAGLSVGERARDGAPAAATGAAAEADEAATAVGARLSAGAAAEGGTIGDALPEGGSTGPAVTFPGAVMAVRRGDAAPLAAPLALPDPDAPGVLDLAPCSLGLLVFLACKGCEAFAAACIADRP